MSLLDKTIFNTDEKIKAFIDMKAEIIALGYNLNDNIYKQLFETAVDIAVSTGISFIRACHNICDAFREPFKEHFEPLYTCDLRGLSSALNSLNEFTNELCYGEDSRDGQGAVYKKLSRFFEKERRQELPIKARRLSINRKIFSREKSCKTTIPPVKNKGWKGKR